eukprot:CAMPEP_0176424442 /NCGR_PEP_ID=MMETSP0127-20121128/10839_1 /TAXON_ID=938130 /ORGANISM="Platyophrya macrostoma, Strain WH" /LENGTH=95 /DNA_ID=CAMNT_0017805499 /DNA_START=199 /DNA_END=486 /DNA_ORIENTATION=+
MPVKKRFVYLRDQYQLLSDAEKKSLRREGELVKFRKRSVTTTEKKKKSRIPNEYAQFVKKSFRKMKGAPHQRIRAIAKAYRAAKLKERRETRIKS